MSNVLSWLRGANFVNSALRYNFVGVAGVRKILDQYASSDPEQREGIRSSLLQTALRHAQKTRYGKQFGDSIDKWPILKKDRLQAHEEDFWVPSLFRVSAETGGTTGTPIRLIRSIANVAIERHFIERLIQPYGVSLKSSKVAVLRADEVKDPRDSAPPYGVHKDRQRHLLLSNPHLNLDTVDWYIDALKRHNTEVLYVYPSMLENLIHLARQRSLSLQVPIVLSSSETVAPALFEEVRHSLGGTLVDYYGLGERVALASATSAAEYYFIPSYGRIELVDTGESANDNGDACCRIIATGFWNSAMPLIRYDTGDIGIVKNEDRGRLTEIENGEIPFTGIQGRSSEYIIGRNGSRISGLNHLPRGVENLVRMQVIQQSLDTVELRLRVTDDFSSSNMQQLRHNVGDMIPPSIQVNIEKHLELLKAPNGKTPFVVRQNT